MNLYDVIVAKKLSGGGGGGGSSDFSTAEVTFNCSVSGQYAQLASVIYDPSASWGLDPNTLPTIVTYMDFEVPTSTSTYTVCLYQGKTIVSCQFVSSISGDIELIDEDNRIYQITGDCTITIS